MWSLIKKTFTNHNQINMRELIQQGAVVLDVRTPSEYNSGHVKKSINIPLSELPTRLGELQKENPIIVCCASGIRSLKAKILLNSNGFNHVHNGCRWFDVEKSLNQ